MIFRRIWQVITTLTCAYENKTFCFVITIEHNNITVFVIDKTFSITSCDGFDIVDVIPISHPKGQFSYIFVTVVTFVTWFATQDHFWQNICNLICEKGLLLEHHKNTLLYAYSCYISTTIHGNCMYMKMFLRSGPLLQIMSYLYSTNLLIYLKVIIMLLIFYRKLFNFRWRVRGYRITRHFTPTRRHTFN